MFVVQDNDRALPEPPGCSKSCVHQLTADAFVLQSRLHRHGGKREAIVYATFIVPDPDPGEEFMAHHCSVQYGHQGEGRDKRLALCECFHQLRFCFLAEGC